MTIRVGDTVRFLDNYGNRYWAVLERGKHKALLRALGRPESLPISTEIRNLTLSARTHRENA